MNYWERHIGDYARDTAHLTMIEHGAYTLLLDRYYATEKPIPADQVHRLARARSKEEKAAVDSVLDEFFNLVAGEWHHNRADREIEKAAGRINAAKENGKKGGRPRKQTETQEKPNGFSLGSVSETQAKAHQTPDTSNNSHTTGAASGLSDVHTEDWQPDLKRLHAYLQRAGIPLPSKADLDNSLTRFNLNFAGKTLSESVRYSKLVTWLTGDHRNGQRTPTLVVPVAGDHAAARKLTPLEQVRAARDRELGWVAEG